MWYGVQGLRGTAVSLKATCVMLVFYLGLWNYLDTSQCVPLLFLHTPITAPNPTPTQVLSNIHKPLGTTKSLAQTVTESLVGVDEDDAEYYERGLPVVSFRFSDKFKAENPHVKQEWVQVRPYD